MMRLSLTDKDAELIAEALENAIADSYSDNEIYYKAPKMNKLRNKILEAASDKTDTAAGFDEYIKTDTDTEADAETRERIDTAREVLNKFWKTWGDCMPGEGCEIIECLGPDKLGYTMRPAAERGSELPFAVAYMSPWENGQKIEDYDKRPVRALIAWVNPETEDCRYEYEEDMPAIHFPPELLGFLSPVPEDSSAGMWRELNRRYWTNIMLCSD